MNFWVFLREKIFTEVAINVSVIYTLFAIWNLFTKSFPTLKFKNRSAVLLAYERYLVNDIKLPGIYSLSWH